MYGELPELKTTDGRAIHGFPVQILNPPKTAVLRLPTDAEVLERLSKQITLTRDLGRGKSKTTPVPELDADLSLFKRIRLDAAGDGSGTSEWDEYEAAEAVQKILYCRVNESSRSGSQFVIELETPLGTCTHTLNGPTARDMYQYREQILQSTSLGRGATQLRYRHSVAISMYDSIISKSEGYAEGCPVPPHHKFWVSLEVANMIDEASAPADPNS